VDLARLKQTLDAPVDIASLALYRAVFGGLMVIAAARFFTHGWITLDYGVPTHVLHYWGFGWVRRWPLWGMYVHYGVMLASAVAVMLGIFYRPAIVIFACSFIYAHLIDKSNYLNHYYLVSLLSIQMALMPLDRAYSLRARLRPASRRDRIRRWMLWLLRFQIGIVYVFGGLGKVGRDWLIHGEPLRIWLSANAELPLLGRFFHWPGAALVMSWGGLLFDLSVVPLLAWRRTRPYAFILLLVFHVITAMLFNIGMFPWIMIASATLFFDPSWPRRWLPRREEPPRREEVAGARVGPIALAALVAYAALQSFMPLRYLLYPGNTLWSEEGFRFSWKVMLIEKSGELELTVVDGEGRRRSVSPREYLTSVQARMTATQPDMILELAHIVARDFERRGWKNVKVFADAEVSFNGRHHAPMIDPTVDLAHESDGLGHKPWILPAPTSEPRF